MSNKVWFKPKRYGYGWTPASWRGWVVTIVFGALIGVSTSAYLRLTEVVEGDQDLSWLSVMYAISVVALVGSLYGFARVTGGKASWRWGDDE